MCWITKHLLVSYYPEKCSLSLKKHIFCDFEGDWTVNIKGSCSLAISIDNQYIYMEAYLEKFSNEILFNKMNHTWNT